MIPKAVQRGIDEYFATNDILDFRIKHIRRAAGGDINEAALLETTEGPFFVKWNDATRYPHMFEAEYRGLELLRAAGEIAIPRPLHTDEVRGTGFLLMEAVEPAGRRENFWYDFGNRLAELHRHTNDYYGLDHDNYIGSLPQYNSPRQQWAEFFVTQRLEIQLRMARDNGQADSSLSRRFERLFGRIEALFPKERPALVHGDLWGGNFMTGSRGEAVLIDPAVYYGHREMDLAMTRLFGGFDEEFYAAYHINYPLESGWQERLDLCNLYPLMVHVNLFGGGYLRQVEGILSRFV